MTKNSLGSQRSKGITVIADNNKVMFAYYIYMFTYFLLTYFWAVIFLKFIF